MIKFDGNKMKDVKIAYIGGGSRDWAWKLMSDLACEEQMSGQVRLYDIDFTAAKDNEIIGNKYSKIDNANTEWEYKAVSTYGEALEGADFVIISIMPGTLNEMESDVHTPEKYGIYQAVGDTTGPGGIIRALRTIPMYVEFAENIKKYCPDAWVINYTNPMTLSVRTLYEVYPNIKAFGCCHEVSGTRHLLAKMLKYEHGYENINAREIMINVLGINHFTWIDKAYYKGIDLMPLYREFVNKYYEEGFEGEDKNNWMNDVFGNANRVKLDLFHRYGVIAAAGDRHLAEFMPHGTYLKDIETIKKWKFNLTPVSWRRQKEKTRKNRSIMRLNGEEELKISVSGEEGVKQMKAILGLWDFVTNVNMPNKGQIEGIPMGAVVETNAHFKAGGVQPIMSGKLPDAVQNLVMRHVLNQETIVKAAINRDKELAFAAFCNDPLVTIGLEEANLLFNEMLHNTKNYLPGWDL